MHLLYFILIGLAAGWLASNLTTGGGLGLVGDIVVGMVGAVIGGFVFRALGVHHHGWGQLWNLLVATVGAIILISIVHLVKRA